MNRIRLPILFAALWLWTCAPTYADRNPGPTSITAVNQAVVMSLDGGVSSVSIGVTGTFVGTLQAKLLAPNNTDWSSAVSVYPYPSETPTAVSSMTAPGTWELDGVGGKVAVEVVCTSYTSGTAVVSINGSSASSILKVNVVAGGGGSSAVTQSGTWTVQPGNTANTTAWLFNLTNSQLTTLTPPSNTGYALDSSLATLHTDLTPVSTAANQTAPQSNAGSDASKAIAVQGLTGGKPVPTTPGAASVVSGSLQTAATATGNGSTLTVTGESSAIYTVTGTFVATPTFEGTADGTNYVSLFATQLGVAASTTNPAITAVGAGDGNPHLYQVSVAGLASIRAHITVYTSGSVTATANASPVALNPIVQNVNVLTFPLIAGENQAANYLATEQDFSKLNVVAGTATTVVKSGAGFLHSIVINTKGASANTLKVYDNTAGSSTLIATIDTTAQVGTLTFDCTITTGITCVSATGTGADYTVSYRRNLPSIDQQGTSGVDAWSFVGLKHPELRFSRSARAQYADAM